MTGLVLAVAVVAACVWLAVEVMVARITSFVRRGRAIDRMIVAVPCFPRRVELWRGPGRPSPHGGLARAGFDWGLVPLACVTVTFGAIALGAWR